MVAPIKDQVAIVGIGQTAFGKGLPDSELSLACQAISAALDDAGVAPSEVDGLSSFTMEPEREQDVARNVGLGDITFFSQIDYGGGAGARPCSTRRWPSPPASATSRLRGGPAKRADKASRVWAQTAARLSDQFQWSRPWGLIRPVDEIAMLTRRYMHEYGATRDHLANVALACRKHANRNPLAQMHERTLDARAVHGSALDQRAAVPLRQLPRDRRRAGVVLVSAERARDLRQRPVYVHAAAQGIPQQHQMMSTSTTTIRCSDHHGPRTEALGARRRRTERRVVCAQIYDAFTPLIPLSLEGYGFCGRGEGGAFTEDGALEWPNGRLPINTSGGGLSEAYVHGFNLITEGVRQMRGTSTSQVAGATTCLVTSGEAVPTSALLLRS